MVNFAKFLRTPFLQNTSGRLHLDSDSAESLVKKNRRITKKKLALWRCLIHFVDIERNAFFIGFLWEVIIILKSNDCCFRLQA